MNWLKKRLYREPPLDKGLRDSVTIGQLTIHLCGPWDWGAPIRLHINWRPAGTSGHWHFAIGRFAKRLHEGPGRRLWYVSTERIEERHRQRYAEWRGEHDHSG